MSVRRHNPYATSFDGSLSASFDRSHQQIASITTECHPLAPRTGPFISAPTVAVLPSRSTPQACDASNFDIHSNCSDSGDSGEHPAHQTTAALRESPEHHHCCSHASSPLSTRTPNATHFDAAAMSAVLATAGCPVDVPCPAGFTLTVYNGDISQHFNVASETVQITRGAIKYADHQQRYGSQTRFRFQLCHNYLQRKCSRLSECSYIHATVLPKPSEVHLNPFAPRRLAADRLGNSHEVPMSIQDDPRVVDAYETLPAGFVVPVFAPNDNGPVDPQLIPSEMIIVTAGALAARRGGHEAARPRHCAHYQFKRLCNLGSQCHFIHSKVPFSGHTAFARVPHHGQQQQQQMARQQQFVQHF